MGNKLFYKLFFYLMRDEFLAYNLDGAKKYYISFFYNVKHTKLGSAKHSEATEIIQSEFYELHTK